MRRQSPTDRFLFADRLEQRRGLLLVVLAILLLMVALLVVTYRRDDRPGARLVVRRAGVERAVGTEQRAVVGTYAVAVGEVIRTDQAGRAQLDYFDGSVTLVDSETTLKVIDLLDRPDRRTIAAKLDGGRIWNRVPAIERTDRFEVRIPNAWVTARGASNIIDCRAAPECTVIGITGTTEVAVDGADVVLLEFGQCTTVGADGARKDCSIPRDQLCADEFTAAALATEDLTARCLEAPLPVEPQVSPAPSPTATPSPTVTPVVSPVPSRSPPLP